MDESDTILLPSLVSLTSDLDSEIETLQSNLNICYYGFYQTGTRNDWYVNIYKEAIYEMFIANKDTEVVLEFKRIR